MWKREQGQTIIIVAFALVVLLLAVGLAIDGGRVMASRRQMQNAADAAAMAGTQELAQVILRCQGASAADDQAVLATVRQYAEQNGVDWANGDNLEAWYVDRDEVRLSTVGAGAIPNTATGVEVSVDTAVDMMLMQLIGHGATTTPANALAMTGRVVQFPGGVLPIAVPLDAVGALDPDDEFYVMETNNQHNGGMLCVDPDGVTCIGDPASHNAHRGWLNLNYIYNIEYLLRSSAFYRTWEQNVPNRDCGPDPAISIDDGIQGWASGDCPYPFPIFAGTPPADFASGPPYSGPYYTDGDYIHGGPGARQSSLQEVYDSYAGQEVYVPVFDVVYMTDYMDQYFERPEGIGWPTAGGGGNAFMYHIVGFVRVTVADVSGNPHYLQGTLEEAIIGEGMFQPSAGLSGCVPAADVFAQGVGLWR
jgi:Flp pilus assembly protein TadG